MILSSGLFSRRSLLGLLFALVCIAGFLAYGAKIVLLSVDIAWKLFVGMPADYEGRTGSSLFGSLLVPSRASKASSWLRPVATGVLGRQ